MLALGLLPKMSALVEAVPVVVLGGAGIVMFGMVAATGVRILTGVDFKANRYNLFVVAISVGFGMIPLVAPNFFGHTPEVLRPLLESGILLAAIVSVLLKFSSTGWAASKPHGTMLLWPLPVPSTHKGQVSGDQDFVAMIVVAVNPVAADPRQNQRSCTLTVSPGRSGKVNGTDMRT